MLHRAFVLHAAISVVVANPSFKDLADELAVAASSRDIPRLEGVESQLLQLFPDFPPTHPVIAKHRMALRFEHTERAVAHMELFLESHPDVHDTPLLLNYGALLAELGREGDAERAYRAAVKGEQEGGKDFGSARVLLSEVFLEKGDLRSLTRAGKLLAPVILPSASASKARGPHSLLARDPKAAVLALRLQATAARSHWAEADEAGAAKLRRLAAKLARAVFEWFGSRHSALGSAGHRGPRGGGPERRLLDPRGAAEWAEQVRQALSRSSRQRTPLQISLAAAEGAEVEGAEAADVWSALGWGVGRWDAERLVAAAGGEWVYAMCPGGDPSRPAGFAHQRRLMRFGAFLEGRERGSRCYLNVQAMRGELYEPPLNGELARDLPAPGFLPLARGGLAKVTLWMGTGNETAEAEPGEGRCSALPGLLPQGAASPGCPCGGGAGELGRLHQDNQDNVIAVLAGEKHYALFPPSQALNLYTVGAISRIEPSGVVRYVNDLPGQGDSAGAHFSHIPDTFEPSREELDRYPLLQEAMGARHIIRVVPGELLYLPAGWFHQVRSCSRHAAVNFWWDV